MTDLEMAGRALVERQPVPLTPVEQIRARALASRRGGVAAAGWSPPSPPRPC